MAMLIAGAVLLFAMAMFAAVDLLRRMFRYLRRRAMRRRRGSDASRD